jgi:UDP-N-acetylglucosamine--N-acetylmuramyl-(pentapeptide) pyrophosphoryl-undecaprenol N-acetylglucosamine transferase
MNLPTHRVIISGGGTGGHLFPAIAIANALRRKQPAMKILFVGALGKMEMEKVPQAGYEIRGLPIAGLQRKLDWKNFLLPFKVINSVKQAQKIISEFRPDAAVGVGGYASAPVLFAASRRKIPCLLQEQNSYAGLTNKLLGRRAQKICVAYEGMEKFFAAEKIILTGNPVRKDIASAAGKTMEAYAHFRLSPHKKTLLVLGGSLGARSINHGVGHHLAKLNDQGIQVLWQTGKLYFESWRHEAEKFPDLVRIHAFIDRMDLAYAAADVVISRAGALSIAELCVTGKPALLVPSPNVAEDHQTKNALALVNRNAALMMADADAPQQLAEAALELIHDSARQEKLKSNIRALARPEADETIAGEILQLIHQPMAKT